MSKPAKLATYDQRARVGRMVNRAQYKLVQALDNAMEPFGISAAQYVILSTLWEDRADTAAQICKEVSYTPGAMTRMLDRLEQKGVIRRSFHANNRRSHKLELTDEGRAIFPDLFDARASVMDHFFGDFSAGELDQFELSLKRMLARD
ncbi:MAG TPA: MarR family transcriptional regulator [Dyella sp.]|uniref:MarR family winged helix-turn-helix transcriptional regulator n=1 Tax=Dyella sp. TaxID=1869338 RepID=UPI002D79EE97|nr:MarR family transcriptional regulator [Dyella sp.]HET6554203.1 MarR family transcriptional regulator [Dyella sp.]